MSMTTVTSPPGCVGSWICLTVPSWMPPTRTGAPLGRPATFLNRASSRYVEENRNCFSPIRNTPTARMTSVPRTNAPTRTGLHMAASSLGISQERVHERFAAVLQIVEGALRENGAFVDERKAVGDG